MLGAYLPLEFSLSSLQVCNTLAYYNKEFITAVKFYIEKATATINLYIGALQ